MAIFFPTCSPRYATVDRTPRVSLFMARERQDQNYGPIQLAWRGFCRARDWPQAEGIDALVLIKNTHAVIESDANVDPVRSFLSCRRFGPRNELGRDYRDLQGGRPTEGCRAALWRSVMRGSTASVILAWRRNPPSRRLARTPFRPAPTSASSTTGRCQTTTTCDVNSKRDGMTFETENDTEVAAAYLTWRWRQGLRSWPSHGERARRSRWLLYLRRRRQIRFRRLRDPVACKPAVSPKPTNMSPSAANIAR